MAKKQTAAIEPEVAEVPDTEAAVTAAAERLAEAKQLVADAQAQLEAANTEHTEAQAEHAAATAPPPVIGPRVKLEHTGEIIAVQPGEERERRLLIGGHNYEHVSDVQDQGETIWVHRRM